ETGEVDSTGMHRAHQLVTRFLMRATYGDVNDPKQAAVLARNRRIGVGHLGVASYLALTGRKYSEAPDDWGFIGMLADLAQTVQDAAEHYAHQLRIPVPVKTRTVAPTGTIAKLAGVSEGIHPIFGKYFLRRIRFSNVNPDEMETVEEYRRQGYGVEPDMYAPNTTVVSLPTKDTLLAQVEKLYGDRADEIVQDASQLTLRDMLRFQRMYQEYWADNAVSYTVNVDPNAYTPEIVAEHIREFGPDLKGATIFPEMSMPQSPYERISRADYELYEVWQQQVADGVDEACVSGCPVK
ncbi:MAG TPA: ribonucleoside-triphosphate reductase, adenosylcobalamin-dependent, partial [Acidimicrobiia bacterium]|nr:ribonucleoside-triphosphate reductase, adenosylcobalamin-dependent [Acidimicrobiia bacterium]